MSDSYSKPRPVSRLAAFVTAGLFAFAAASALAQSQSAAVIPNRITQAINPDQRVTLQHNVAPLAQARYDQGAAPGSMATGRIMLVLKRSDMQEQALKQYIGDLQNPYSPNYRKWLTPAQIGAQYGISDTDLTTVTAWLQSQGFTVDKVPQARNVVIFNGNVAQIQQAFNTSIHKYLVNGETHFANSTDPQIPAALAPVIAGIAQLNDFRPKRGAQLQSKAHFDTDANRIKPDLTLNQNGTDYLFADAADAATIYDTPNSTLNPKYTGTTYDGTGVTIGIAGDSNITAQDVALYRAAFLPSSYTNQPNIIVDGNDPGVNGDAIEALLDLEVSGGIAPGAKVNFYTSADTDLQAGLFIAIFRALDDNAVSILNVSFGACEANQGASGNSQILSAWEQAAAQGISVTVSTGDSGSASCDNDNTETAATLGLAVSGLASTPYNIAVGGTDYDVLLNSFSTYVAASNSTQNVASTYYRTALSYIPESPWNDSTSTNVGAYTANLPLKDSNGNTNIAGGGGGISSCSNETNGGGCLGGYATPAFQTGLSGFPYATRALPDVSFLAADGLYGALWVVCSDNVANGSTTPQTDCEQTSGTFTSSTTFTGVGGTSAAAPAFAGMLALVLQEEMARTGNKALRFGQANNVLYNLASQAALYPTVFHDVTTGNNSVFCQPGSPNCGSNDFLTGYNAGVGYDAASGLGSVDVAQLIANWTKAAFTPTTTTLAATNSTSVTHGTAINFNIAVSPAPGQSAEFVSLINNSGLENNGALVDGAIQLSSSGTATQSTGDLPGGSYNVYAYYGGDVNHSGSQSAAVPVNISPESSTVAIGATMIDPSSGNTVCDDVTGSAPSCSGQTSLPYGLATAVSAQVQGKSGSNTVATGSITYADTGETLPSPTVAISSIGLASYNNYVNQNQSLSVASHGLTASYSGDVSYSASNSGSAYSFTIVKGATSVAVAGSQTGTTVTLQAQINTDSIGVAPTGTVTFAVGTTTLGTAPTASATGFVSAGTVASLYQIAIPASTAGLVSGNNTITATYAGDTNYVTSNGSATIVVTGGGGGGGSFALAGAAISVTAGATTGNTSAISVTPASGFTGAVALTCALTSSPTGASDLPTCALSPTSVTISGTTAGTSTLTVASTAHTSSALVYPLKNVFEAAGGTVLACILMFTIPARRKGWRAILSLIAFAIAISGVIGCGGGSGSGGGGNTGGTTSGTYVFTVTGSGSASGSSTTASTTVQVTIN